MKHAIVTKCANVMEVRNSLNELKRDIERVRQDFFLLENDKPIVKADVEDFNYWGAEIRRLISFFV